MTGKRARACVEGLARRAILGTLQEIQNQKKSCPGTQAVDRLRYGMPIIRDPPPVRQKMARSTKKSHDDSKPHRRPRRDCVPRTSLR